MAGDSETAIRSTLQQGVAEKRVLIGLVALDVEDILQLGTAIVEEGAALSRFLRQGPSHCLVYPSPSPPDQAQSRMLLSA